MPKVETKTITLPTEDGGIILAAVPVGPITEPSEAMKAIVNTYQDRDNWKRAMHPAAFASEALAREYAAAVDFYMGGHEFHDCTTPHVPSDMPCYVVTSKGYYHYVGA